MTWRDDVEARMREAGKTLRCAPPLPEVVRAAIPTPIGRTVTACPAKLAPGALMRLHEVFVTVGRADLTARQRDILWSRAFDLTWKEIGRIYPRVSSATLRREHDVALDEIGRQLRATQGKTMSNRKSDATR